MVSIVVPIYNVEKYLRVCLDSILNQTYKDIQIVLVDDGSTDSCPDIVDEYAISDSRIVPIHKENGGLSSARNCGMEFSTGEYIMFLDSDDYIDLSMVERLVYNLEDNDADIAVCEFDLVSEDGSFIKRHNKDVGFSSYTGIESLAEMFLSDSIGWNAWNKLYRRKLFDGVVYPSGLICEDKSTTYLLYYRSEKVVYDRNIFYHYRIRENSISGIKSIAFYRDSFESEIEMHEFFSSNNLGSIADIASSYTAAHAVKAYAEIGHNEMYSCMIPIIKSALIDNYQYCFKSNFMSCFKKMIVFVLGALAKRGNFLLLDVLACIYGKRK